MQRYTEVIRACDGCTLCCKVMGIDELEKPPGEWCARCDPRKGCTDYANRPKECREFHCRWILDPNCGDEWKPSSAKLVMVFDSRTNKMVAYVDPATPHVWRREPFFSWMKSMSAAAIENSAMVMVAVQGKTIVITPRGEIDVGLVSDTDLLVVSEVMTPDGAEYRATVHRKPRDEN